MEPGRLIDKNQNINATKIDEYNKTGKTSTRISHPPGGEDHLWFISKPFPETKDNKAVKKRANNYALNQYLSSHQRDLILEEQKINSNSPCKYGHEKCPIFKKGRCGILPINYNDWVSKDLNDLSSPTKKSKMKYVYKNKNGLVYSTQSPIKRLQAKYNFVKK